ncbi:MULTISPECIES: aldo/keto reductase [Burkholderiaceae]|jgi:aryl-alcohol dehydrogenase-like predicted oxidoreductase|uniref:aldo/keto reductase n=1 Tax=Burkholderiaceae TaxID=119060 RepID=UPI00057D98A1|nr:MULTISPECIES: aldo/keto reductase [Burkholderiaceae]KHS13945.1 aldo/keto reductase [Burkholderia multivorans]MDR9230245.1 Aldo-keto reductase IolS [Burkholderia multivorans]PRF10246.1 aldo/keto reductase [Burkholderia multivorans]USX10705.1 aldo/keto reductase [Paraburkholderia fungorum]HDR9474888.1 aldo/keto reductase [Burkholderia multivorans]
MSTKPEVKLGATGPTVFPIALGCMGMGATSWYGKSDESENVATIHKALEHGVNVLDTGDFYGMGRNELLLGKALQGRRDKALLSVKFGAQRGPDGAIVGRDARPQAVKNALAHSLSRLGVDYIDIYRTGLDPNVPIEDTVGAMSEMVKAGYVRYIALSEVSADTVRRAATVHPICDVQLEYSLISRSIESKIVPTLAELGVAITAYGVLSRGLLTAARPKDEGDARAQLPRFEFAKENEPLVNALARVAAGKNVTPSQLAIAWVRARGAALGVTIVPTLGARTRAQLADVIASLDVSLDAAEVAALEQAVPASAVVGTRYPEAWLHTIDSEK